MQLIIDFRNSDVSAALQNLANDMKSEIVLKIEGDLGMKEVELTVMTGNDHAFINSAELPALIDDVIVRELQATFGQTVTVNTDHFDGITELVDRAAERFGNIFTRLQTEANSTEFSAKMLVDGRAVGDFRETLGGLVTGGTWADIEQVVQRGKQQVVTIMRNQLEEIVGRLNNAGQFFV